MSKHNYSIYQLKDGAETRDIRFEPLERLLASGKKVDRANYELVYAGAFDTGVERLTNIQILNDLYAKFNIAHPLDYAAHSLSISDVVVLRFYDNDLLSAHYVDRGAFFSQVPEFLDGPYRYYSTQRPVDIGTFPKTEGGPEHIENYDKRGPVEDGRFLAWGHLDYSTPLTEKQMEDYELRVAFDNPDLYRYPPRQLDAQLQVVGKWEAAQDMPEATRFTERQPGTDSFRLKDPAKRWPMNVRFNRIVAERKRRPSIEEQLAEGAARAARDNAARPIPGKDAEKDR